MHEQGARLERVSDESLKETVRPCVDWPVPPLDNAGQKIDTVFVPVTLVHR